MEYRFENRYHTTHHMLAEFGRKYSVGPRMPLVIIFWVLYAFSAIPVLVDSAAFGENVPRMLLIMGVVMLIFSFMPHWYTWMSMRGTKKQNDNIQPEVILTFGDTIELYEGMVHITVEYRKIVRVLRLKHSYMLMIGKRNGVMLDLNGLTKGTFEEFKQFLREKRPDLTIPE